MQYTKEALSVVPQTQEGLQTLQHFCNGVLGRTSEIVLAFCLSGLSSDKISDGVTIGRGQASAEFHEGDPAYWTVSFSDGDISERENVDIIRILRKHFELCQAEGKLPSHPNFTLDKKNGIPQAVKPGEPSIFG